MRITPSAPKPVASQPATPTARPAAAPAVAERKADGFVGASRSPVALDMLPPPPAARPAESSWYQFKKKVVLFFTGIDYDPHVHKLDAQSADKLRSALKPGDVLLRRTDGTTSNWFIPGYWGHAALYAGDGKIVDAVTHDVRETDLNQFCAEGDAVIVVRPKGLGSEQVQAAVEHARAQLGKPYDFDLDFEDRSRFSCTELVADSLATATGRKLVEGTLGKVSPKDFLNDNFEFVWSSLGTMPG